MNRLQKNKDFFRRYEEFGAQGDFVVAKAIYEKIGENEQENKLLRLYLFYLLMNSCESVVRMARVVKELPADAWENLLKNDIPYFSQEKIEQTLTEVQKYENHPKSFFSEYLSLDVQDIDSDPVAISGIVNAVIAALKNLSSPINKHIYFKIKHGFVFLDKKEKESAVIYFPSEAGVPGVNPVEMPLVDINGRRWLDTIHSLSNTLRNLASLIADIEKV